MSGTGKKNNTIPPFFIVFLLYVSMVGGGVFTFQKKLIEYAGYNAWLSVILTGASIHIILWFMFRLSSSGSVGQSITAVNNMLFGNIAGKIINLTIVLYIIIGACIKMRLYTEIIHVWLFPAMNMLPISLILVLLIYYTVTGGLRTVTGLSMWAAFFSLVTIIPQSLLSISYWHPLNLKPLIKHSILDILISSRAMVSNYLGVELLLVYFPLIDKPEKSQRWAHLAVGLVTLLFLLILLLTFLFFSEGQLHHTTWPTLQMISIFEVPLFQRLEYLALSLWLIKIIAGVSVYVWAACHGTKTAFRLHQRIMTMISLAVVMAVSVWIVDHKTIERLSEWYSTIGFYFLYAYIPFIFICVHIQRWWGKKNSPKPHYEP